MPYRYQQDFVPKSLILEQFEPRSVEFFTKAKANYKPLRQCCHPLVIKQSTEKRAKGNSKQLTVCISGCQDFGCENVLSCIRRTQNRRSPKICSKFEDQRARHHSCKISFYLRSVQTLIISKRLSLLWKQRRCSEGQRKLKRRF